MATVADDAAGMARAVRWARRGLGSTYPNPCVGAVIVRRGEVIGAAHSAATGGPHAEVRAIARAGAAARGATLYVTLEPCCHHGRTGPCTEAIAAAGIAKVVVGVRDPAAHASGKGIARLRRLGIEVVVLESTHASAVHAHYLHHVRTARPFVTLKAAVGVDGRIAVATGDSKWITSDAARRDAHRLRAEHHAIAVGVGTVASDDPRLDVRLVRGRSPIAVVFDTRLRVLARGKATPAVLRPGTLVLHGPDVAAAALTRVRSTGAEPIAIGLDARGHVDVELALAELGRREIRSLLVEGGGTLHGAFVRAAAWQRWIVYTAPRLLGRGPSLCDGVEWARVADAPRLLREAVRPLGDDLRCDYVPAPASARPRPGAQVGPEPTPRATGRAVAVKRGRLR